MSNSGISMEPYTNTSFSTLRPPRPDFSDKTTLKKRVRGSAGSGLRRGGERARKEIENQYNHKHNQAAFKKYLSLIQKNLSRYNEI